MTRRILLPALVAALLAGGGFAAAQTGGEGDAGALLAAKREADEATRRSQQLEQQAAQATNEAARARAEAAALAARIEAAEADISAAEARVRIIAVLAAQQRARLAEKQAPLVRLTAALQTMARRPPALALVQPGSVDDVVHIRSLLASTLPVVRARTAALRYEVERGEQLRRQAGTVAFPDDDIAFMSELEASLDRRTRELQPFDALTPHVQEIRYRAR